MATAQPTVDAPPKKGKSKKLLIILIAAVLALGAVGGGVLFYIKKKHAAEEAELAEDEEQDVRPAKEQKRDPNAKPVFVALELFTVNLADRESDRYAQIAISLELNNEKAGDLIKNHMPIIRNYILMTLSHKTSAELLDRNGKLELAKELRREIARALGLEVDEPPPPRKAAAGEAAPGAKEEPKPRKRKLKPEEISPVIAVHFSNFIIQ